MIRKRLFLVLTLVMTLGLFNTLKAQPAPQNSIAIVLNEYCMGNFTIADNYGYHSDWVEILNNFSTFSVSLNGYYLSNDRSNRYKWKFPASYTLAPNGLGIVYLSGKNESRQVNGTWYHHASFNIDQCKNQWLILTTPDGVIRDSVFVQKTKAGHTRGRVNTAILGVEGWRIYTTHSFGLSNPIAGYYKGYLPTPIMKPDAGWGHNGASLDMYLEGSNIPYDATDTSNCYEIHYTDNGCVPTYTDPVYTYTNAGCGGPGNLIIIDNQMYRAITLPKLPTAPGTCSAYPICYPELNEYLPSFIQTNTYFSEATGSMDGIDPNFGVLSLAMDCPDQNWFSTNGTSSPQSPLGHVEYFDNQKQVCEGYSTINRPVNDQWTKMQKGFYVNIDDRHGFGCNFEGNIFNNACLGTSSRSVFPTLHVHAGGSEAAAPNVNQPLGTNTNGTAIRDVFLQSLAVKYDLKVNPLHIKPLIVFINGKYQGAYNLREVYDKYYENYYKGQPKDSLYLQMFDQMVDSYVFHNFDNTTALPFNQPLNRFKTEVYDWATTRAMNSPTFYNQLMGKLDKQSFIDYMIINSYAQNKDLFTNNIAFARGLSSSRDGDKWHYFLWNAPNTFNFTTFESDLYKSACETYTGNISSSALAGNTHGALLKILMNGITGNLSFQKDYKNRYQDLLNTALKCENILSHYDCVVNLFSKEMKFHENQASQPQGMFYTQEFNFDTNTVRLRRILEKRCQHMSLTFSNTACYNMDGPYAISVDVYPPDAGKVKLSTVTLPNYIWRGQYFSTQLEFKATPTSTNYVFHHWEFKNHVTKNNAPLSLDSVAIDYNQSDDVLAVFTDVTQDIDLPTGFTPNSDGNNDVFKPQGSASYTSEYDFRIWNRWGQEVFRSTDPDKGWDGFYEGKQAQTGVYAYVITYKNVYNEPKIKKGNVTLVR